MTPLPKHLKEMRDELAEVMWKNINENAETLHARTLFKHGFEKAASIMLKDMEEMAKALEFYDGVHRLNWAIDFNDLPKVADEALKNYREKYGE